MTIVVLFPAVRMRRGLPVEVQTCRIESGQSQGATDGSLWCSLGALLMNLRALPQGSRWAQTRETTQPPTQQANSQPHKR